MNNFKNGTVVAVSKGIIEHVGILARHLEWGYPTVISNSKAYGKVVEEPLSEFTQGEQLTVKGYIGGLASYQVIDHARSLLNEDYNLFSNNCEHFVSKVHGKVKESPQLQAYIFGVIIFLFVWLFKK